VPRTKRLTDATLVRRSQQGDRRAFRALLGRYDWRLRGLAYALLLDRAEMDVAVTTGYVRAWRDVVRIKPKDDVATWLYRVTYNACIDRLRHLEAAAARAASEGEPAAGGPREELTGIAAGLASLSAPERVAVVLVDREGFSPSSAARILGQTPGTLQRLLQRARDKLAAHVDEQGLAAPAPATDAAEEAATAEAGAAGDAGGEPSPAAEASAGPDAEVDAAASEGSAVEPEAVAPAPDPGAPAGGAAVADTAEPGAPAADGAAVEPTAPAEPAGPVAAAAEPRGDDAEPAAAPDAGTAPDEPAPARPAPDADAAAPAPAPEGGAQVVPLDLAADPAERTPLVRVIAPGDDETAGAPPTDGDPAAEPAAPDAGAGRGEEAGEGADDAAVIPVPLARDRGRGRRGRRKARAAARRSEGAPRTGTDDPPGDPS